MKHKWISNEAQPGVQTDIGLWHTLPHPDLAVQVMREGYEDKPDTDRYWHPDFVVFKGKDGWYVNHRTSGCYAGPYKTKGDAKAAVEVEA